MKIDPNLLVSQFIDYHIGVITDWVKWVQLERASSTYQNMLTKTVASNDPFVFFEIRLDEFLSDYVRKEKKILNDYLKLIKWLKENRITEATRKVAVDTEVYAKRKEIEEMVAMVNTLATDLLDDCKKRGYTGDHVAFLEVLAAQDVYIKHS